MIPSAISQQEESEVQRIDRVFQRRLQKSGRASMTIVLPRQWVNRLGLKTHDMLSVKWEENGSLHLSPTRKEELKSICILDADRLTAKGSLVRALVADYIEGHSEVKIVARRSIPKELLEDIHKIVPKLIGSGIVQEIENRVVLRCFVDPTSNGIPQLLVRIYAVSSIMLSKFYEALARSNPELLQEVIKLDDEVDRAYYLILRQLFTAAKDPAIAEALGVKDSLEIVGDRCLAQLVEDAGDRCQKSAVSLQRLLPHQWQPIREFAAITQLGRELHALYDKAFKAFISIDYEAANAVIEASESLEERMMSLTMSIEASESIGHRLPYTLLAIAIDMAGIARHCRAIAEITFNRAAGRCILCRRE